MLVALQTLATARDISADYTGLPQLAVNQPYEIRGHSATIRVEGNTVVIESTTEYRNRGTDATATILVPRRREGDAQSGQPTFSVNATWDKQPIKFTPIATRGTSERIDDRHTHYASDLNVNVPFKNAATHALRIRATIALGKVGKGAQQRVAAYLLEGSVPIGVLNVAYQYDGGTVFGLPEAEPDFGWQIGNKGAFGRKTDFTPNSELTSIIFWPGGFKP